ncbi:PASTA domain-containing protein [Nonomuraea sp. NPDC049646]|uniref:PASTA domain-containing protein n=1 Tax=unclassified Nonomuraea TaxID=2593643 RepID=UPI003793436C
MRPTPALAMAAALTIAATSCTSSGSTTPQPAVVTVTASPTPTTETPVARKRSTPADRRKLLPDVTGMNLQAAQDKLQATGFYVLDDQDATGQGRLQVFDRNWKVVRQSPAAGKHISTSTLITLYAKKYGE